MLLTVGAGPYHRLFDRPKNPNLKADKIVIPNIS